MTQEVVFDYAPAFEEFIKKLSKIIEDEELAEDMLEKDCE